MYDRITQTILFVAFAFWVLMGSVIASLTVALLGTLNSLVLDPNITRLEFRVLWVTEVIIGLVVGIAMLVTQKRRNVMTGGAQSIHSYLAECMIFSAVIAIICYGAYAIVTLLF